MAMVPYDEVIPDEPLPWLREQIRDVVWAPDPRDQITANIFLFIIALLSSAPTLGATLVLAFIFFVFTYIGFLRLGYELAIESNSAFERVVLSALMAFGVVIILGVLGYPLVGIGVGFLIFVAAVYGMGEYF